MGFNPTFYAGRTKLSEVTIDSDLDMGGRNILRARIGSPHGPETWPTKTLDWGGTAPSEYSPEVAWTADNTAPDYELFTNSGPGAKYRVKVRIPTNTWKVNSVTIKVDGVTVASRGELNPGETYESTAFGVETGQTVVVTVRSSSDASYTFLSYQCTGEPWGAKTFDLSGKWLALGIDMHGLDATIKIQGVEVPYSDYAKYFPLAPSELKILGGWDATQTRPDVEVYL